MALRRVTLAVMENRRMAGGGGGGAILLITAAAMTLTVLFNPVFLFFILGMADHLSLLLRKGRLQIND